MATYEIKSPDGQTWEVNAPDDATEQQVLAYAQSQWEPTKPAGGGRGFVQPPAASDAQGNRLRELQDPNLSRVERLNLADTWTQNEMARLADINPGASADDLAALAAQRFQAVKDGAPAPLVDRVSEYLNKPGSNYDLESAKANAKFDEGVERRFNLSQQSRAPDANGDRVTIGYNPIQDAQKTARDTQELADLRDDALGRVASGEMNSTLRGFVKGGVQSAGLTAATVGYLADVVGADAVKQWGLDTNNAAARIANQMTLAKTASQIQNLDDFQGWLAENGGYVAYQAAEALLTGGLVSGVSKQAARQAAIEATALGMNNLRQTLGSVYADAVDEAKRTGKDPSLFGVALGAVGSAVIDTVADKFGLDAMTKTGFKGAVAERMAKSIGSQALMQGGTEALQLVPEEMGAGRDPFRDGMGAQFFDEAAVGALGGGGPGVLGGLNKYQEPTGPTAEDIARSKGFLTPEPIVAPRVEDMPTTPTVPTVKPAAQNVVENIASLLGQQTPTPDAGAAPAVEAPTVQPPVSGVPGQTDVATTEPVSDATQPAAVPAADAPAPASLSNPTGPAPFGLNPGDRVEYADGAETTYGLEASNPAPAIPAGTDPRQAALAKIEEELQASKARQEAETKAQAATAQAEQETAAAADLAKRSVGSAYQQTSATPTPQPGAVPTAPEGPALPSATSAYRDTSAAPATDNGVPTASAPAAPAPTVTWDKATEAKLKAASESSVGRGMVKLAMDRWNKNSDLTDSKTYPEAVLYGIINSPDVGPDLLASARQEIGRRRGTNTQPTVSYTGTTQPGTTSLGVGGQSQPAAGLSSYPAQQPAVAAPVGQAVGGQPVLSSRATANGSAAPAGTTKSLAPTAPDALLARVSEQLKADRGVQFTPFKGQLTTGQQVASAFANANGRTFTVVERTAGNERDMPNGFAIPGTNHVVIDSKASDAPVLVAVHEVYHLLPTKLRIKANKALRALFKEDQATEFGREFNVTPEQFEEEIPAYMAQAVASRPTFWQELRTKMGNKDFSEFAGFVLQKFKDLMRGAEKSLGEGFLQKYIGEESNILEAQRILSDLYVESMREQGLQPDEALAAPVMMSQKRTQNTEQVGEHEVTPAKDGSIFVHGDPEAIRAKIPEGVKGRVEAGGVRFTHSDAPRVRGALSGNQIAYSRGGQVNEKLALTKDGKYLGAPEKFNTPGKVPTLRRWLRQLAEEGAPGRYWYENSSAAILHMTGGDVQEARKFVALLAIYSPQAKVDANSTFALRAWSQYKMGQPISVKTGVMDRKAQAALDDVDAFWSGEKTGNFFHNLLSEIDPTTKGKQGATIDMWMMRAGQYSNDAPTKTQYAFMENETNRLARELGWEPQQVQAAIWVAMKARMENTGVKKRTEAISEKKGWLRYDYPLKKGTPTKTRVVQDAQKHRDNWLDQAFKHDPSKQDTATAKFDFSDGVRRHIGQVSWEARPGRSTGVLPGVNDAPYDQQVEFQQAVHRALLGPNGEDLLAQKLGLLVDGEDLLAPGIWQGEVAAGMQKQVAMAPAKGDEGKTGLDTTQKQALDTYSAVLGLLLRQEGVGWHRPFYNGKKSGENGAELRIGSPFTPEQAQELWSALDAAMQAKGVADWEQSAGLISSPQGMRVVNFGALKDNGDFQRLVESAANGLSFDVQEHVRFTSDGNLVTNDWRANPDGTTYQTAISDAGRSDLLGWSRDVLAPRVQQVFDDFSERYDWGNPGSINFSNKPGDGLGGVHAERGPGARAHAVRIDGTHFSQGQRTSLDGRYFGRGLKGAEQSRLSEASDSRIKERVYFYVDEGKGITPEAGVGGYAHAASVDNLYNTQGDPLKLFRAGDINGSESRVLDAGFDGYYFPNYVNGQGIAVVMGNASRGIKVSPTEYAKGQAPAAPAQPYKRGLSSKELNAIDMPAVQAVAPSSKLRAGTFQVDESELDAARAELANQGITLPGTTPFSNKAQDLDQDITLEIPIEGGKTAKLTVNAASYIKQLDAREEALKMVKECML